MKFIRTKRGLLCCGLLLVMIAGLIWRSRQPGALEQRIARYRAAGLPTTLAELDASYPAVSDAENASIPLLEAVAAWRKGTDTNLPITHPWEQPHYPSRGKAWPTPVLHAVWAELTNNAVSLAQIHAALDRPRSYYPVIRGGVLNLSHCAPLKQAVWNLALEARYAAETDDLERATQAILAALRVARTLEEEPLFSSHATRISLTQNAVDTAEGILSRRQFSDSQLARLQEAYGLAEASNHLRRALVGERVLKLEALHDSYRQLLLSSSPPVSWQEHLAAAVLLTCDLCGMKQRDIEYGLDRLDDLAEAAALPRSAAPARQRQLETKLQEIYGWSMYLRPLAWRESWKLRQILPMELGWLATLRSAQTAIAIERWRLVHGGVLPLSLNELVPQYLAAVPEDPIDGKPLRYRALSPSPGYVVYSIGEDETDDAGKPDESGKVRGSGFGEIKGDYTFTVAR